MKISIKPPFKLIREIQGSILFFFLGAVIAILIYLRENDVQDQVSFAKVLIWQLAIWMPWSLAFPVFDIAINKRRIPTSLIIGFAILWIASHFVWFFYLSANFSPYIGLPGSRYGVYPYFFIFWTLIDVSLIRYVFKRLKRVHESNNKSEPLLLELTRGYKKYYCKPDEIYWLSAEGYNTKLYTAQGIFLMRNSLTHYYSKFGKEIFKRIHRSTVVNVNYVSGLTKGPNDSLVVLLKDGTNRRVSRNYTKEIRAFFKESSI